MLCGHVFVGHRARLRQTTIDLIHAEGATLVENMSKNNNVTCGIVSACSSGKDDDDAPRWFRILQRLRMPIVYEDWLHARVAGHDDASSRRGALICFDPSLMDHIIFTTTQLPRFVKMNVVAAMQAMGARYSRHLTSDTNFLVCCPVMDNTTNNNNNNNNNNDASADGAQTKLLMAKKLGLAMATPRWVHRCFCEGRWIPADGGNASTTTIATKAAEVHVRTSSPEPYRRDVLHDAATMSVATTPPPSLRASPAVDEELERFVDDLLRPAFARRTHKRGRASSTSAARLPDAISEQSSRERSRSRTTHQPIIISNNNNNNCCSLSTSPAA